jgi:hypothetical protein
VPTPHNHQIDTTSRPNLFPTIRAAGCDTRQPDVAWIARLKNQKKSVKKVSAK